MYQILNNNLGKHLRLVFAVFFFFAQVFPEVLTAFAQPAALPVAQFHLPEEEGHIETVFEGRNSGWVAIIKDAHAIPQTQNSIAQILARLEQSYGVDWVGAEGAAGIFQTQLFRSFPDARKLKEKLSDFIQRGELGGAAIAALNSKGPAVFEGIEDAWTYETGLRDYQRARKELGVWQRSLNQLEREVVSLKKKHYSLRGQSWDFKFARLDAPDPEARAWAGALLEMRQRIPYFSKKYPNLNAAWIEMRISRAGADSMRPRIQNWKEAMEQMDPALRQLAAWQADFQAWRTGGLNDAEYAVRLQAFCEARELKIDLPGSLSALVSLGGRLKALRGGAWVQEWGLARAEAEQLVFADQAEKQVFELDQILNKLKKAADLKISRDEWVRLSQNEKTKGARDSEIEAVTAKLRKLGEQFLESAAADFYNGAVKREAYFESKLDQSLKGRSGRRAAVVLGGFHAEALADSLRKKGISFVVLMPATGAIPETTLYENLMRGEVSWSAHFKIINGRIRIYESFAAAMIHRLLNLSQQKQNPEQVLAYFKNWRENLMRGILRPQQSQEALGALTLLDREVLSSLYGEAFETAQAKALARLAPSSLKDAQALFRAASGMALQPWAAAPLGNLNVTPMELQMIATRSEARAEEEDDFDHFGQPRLRSRASPNNFHANLTNNEVALSLYFARFHSSSESLINLVRHLSEPQAFERFRKNIEDLASWDVRVLSRHFGPDDRKPVMAFILMTASDLFEKTKNWHHDFFNKLSGLRVTHAEFFDGALPVVLDSEFSPQLARKSWHEVDKALVMAFSFSEQVYKMYDEKTSMHRVNVVGHDGKAEATVSGGLGKIIKPEVTYAIDDGIYPELNYGYRNDLFSTPGGWKIRVPFRNPAKHEEGWDRVQALILTPTQEAPKGSLSSYLRNATKVTFLPNEDGSYSTELEDLEQLVTVHEAAANYGYIVTMDHPLSMENFHNPPPKIKIRLYPREVRGANLSLKQKMDLLFERQIRTGQLVRESGRLRWVPFMRILEDGETVYYAVYKDGQATLFRGAIPVDVQITADYIFILNAARAKRPGVSASAPTSWPSDKPGEAPHKTIEVAPAFIEGQIPDEMFFYVSGPSGQRWMFAPNRFPILPPWLNRPQEEQPQALVITHEVHPGQISYPQNQMHDEPNILDLLSIHGELEGLFSKEKSTAILAKAISIAMGEIFKEKSPDAYNLLITGRDRIIAVNGYHPPNAPIEAHGGASQLHGHAQQIKFRLPLQNLPDSAFTNLGEFKAGDETVQVLLLNAQGQTALVFERQGQRAFVFSRPNGRPEGFGNIWSFMELGRGIVVEDIARFFNLTREEREDLQKSNPSAWVRRNAEKLIQRGAHTDLLSTAQKAFARNRKSVTASPDKMRKLGMDVITAMNGKARSELRLTKEQVWAEAKVTAEDDFIAAGEVARALALKYPAHFVPAAIAAGNRSAAMRDDAKTRQKNMKSLMAVLERRAHAHFSKSKKEPLHLGFAMAYDPAVETEMLLFAEKIQELKILYGERIQNHFKVFLTPAQAADEDVKKFTANLKLKGAVAKEVSTAVTVSGELKDRHFFAYGLENLGISSDELFTEVRHLAVDSDYSMQDIFSVALALNLHTAFEPRLDSEVVEKIPQQFQHVLGLRKGRLAVLAGLLETQLFEAQIQKLISSMA